MTAVTGAPGWTVTDWTRLFTEQAELLRAAATNADLATPVPSEPGWTLRDLIVHTALFAQQVTRYLATGTRIQLRPTPPPDIEDPLGILDASVATCADTLANTPSHRAVWTFSPTAPDLAWVWHRRAAHELNLRRWDAQSALRILGPTDENVALDGIDEILGTLLGAKYGQENTLAHSGTVLVTGRPRTWLVTLTPGQVPHISDEQPNGTDVDAELTGPATNVLYQLRNRTLLTGTGNQSLLRDLVVR